MPKATPTAAPKPPASRGKAAAPAPAKRRRIDWEAVERDYRPDTLTLRELADKHGIDHATIARKIKADRASDPGAWPRDLTAAVRDATNAKLMQAMVTSEVTKGQQEVTNAVLAAAEVNTQVILRHRTKLAEVTAAADLAKAKVVALLANLADIREAATAMGAVESWSRITKTVVDKEREAYGLNAQDKPPDDGFEATLRGIHDAIAAR